MRLDRLATSAATVQAQAADLQALFLEAHSVRAHTYITIKPCCRHIMQVLLTDFVKKNYKTLVLNYNYDGNFNVLLTVHLSIILVNDQLEAQLFYSIIRLLQSSTCFEQRGAHHQEVKFY
jgi:hypothetical protein